ncbi:type IV secretory system conjugative DNA transfer family protein [Tenacibaculum xiamenense]|uniref:type IV secretory system conjugative DNA transfer family protein n=1 Tax=Tenacibaculum xiamenense TaxID=1261553 RepID=UPI003894C369
MSLYNTLFNSNRKHQKLYGSVSYMKNKDLRKLFHRKPQGISLDGIKHLKPEFSKLSTLVIAQPGSGKSTLIKSTILQKTAKYPHSFWVIDPASDIYRDTHRWIESQSMDSVVINLDSASESVKINILEFAAKTTNGIEDLASLFMQIQYEKSSGGDPFWKDSAENMLVVLMRCVTAENQKELPRTLNTVYTLLNWFGSAEEKLDRFVITHLKNDEKTKEEYKAMVANSSENSKMLLSVVSTAKSALAKIVNNTTLNEIVSSTSYDITSLRKKAQGIYIQVREDRLGNSGVKAMLSILNKMLLGQCMELPKKGEEQLDVHAYIDEAGTFYLQNLDSYIVVMRKRAVSIMLIFQDLHQLDMYGSSQKKVIASTCMNKIIFGSVSYETASWASKLVGNDTKEVFERPVGVPLISAQELRDLPVNSFLYLHKNKAKIMTMRPWYKQRKLVKRSRL